MCLHVVMESISPYFSLMVAVEEKSGDHQSHYSFILRET